jgi:heparin binding hemagglutinin HbhA
MALADTFEKTLKNVDVTPFYAVIGVGDLAVEKIRNASNEVQVLVADTDPKAVPAKVQAAATARVEAVTADMKARSSEAKDFPTMAQNLFFETMSQAIAAYGELAERGKELVTRARSQRETELLESQAKATVAKAKATATTTKKSAAATKKSAKSTATSARKTGDAASKAAKATAKKVGD